MVLRDGDQDGYKQNDSSTTILTTLTAKNTG